MATAAILVNGLPGSGKSTLGTQLALLLGCPFLSKDAVKESLADLTGQTVSSRALGGIAMDTVWDLAREIVDGVVIDSFWFRGRDDDFLRGGVVRSKASHVVELWCDVPLDVASSRYDERYDERHDQRERHGIHDRDFGDWTGAGPIGHWPVVRVDTSSAVDFDALLPELASHLL
jgi:predicted kinase